MTCESKTVKVQGTFEVHRASGTVSPKKVLSDLATTVEQVQDSDPWKVAGNTINQQISFGGVTLAKYIYLKTDYQVTVKLQQQTDTGFPWLGAGIIPSKGDGISGLWITTGPNETCVEVVVCGD